MVEYRLPEIPRLRLRATFAARAPVQLPGYLGSTLRGAFGHALRRLVCVMGPAQPCATCSLRGPCVHTRLFETFLSGDPPPMLRGVKTAPRPYLFEPRTPLRAEPQSLAGPFNVETVSAGYGHVWAVVRRGEPVAEGHRAPAVFLDRTAALLAAAVLPACAAPNPLHVAEKAKRLGLPIHDGRRHLGHLARRHEHLARDLHVA